MKQTALYQQILENLFTPVMVMRDGELVVYLNIAAQSLFEASLNRVEDHHINDFLLVPKSFRAALGRAELTGQQITEREVELALTSDLRKIKVDCIFTPITERGTSGLILVELIDTEVVLRFAREESRIAQQNALKLLLRGLAHEVKNPLGGLRGAAQLLDRALPNEELREYTRIIIGEADRLQRLVDDVLGPNKILRKTPTNIHEVLEHVRQLVLAESPETLVIDRDYDPSIPELNLDRDRMIQAVLNIVKNAKQALENQGRIVLRTRTLRRYTIGHHVYRLVLKLDIMDNGPGVPSSLIDQIFFPMVTTRADGTGLGLSISQTIVTQHEGVIECSSVTGETVFSILLPIERQATGNHFHEGK